MTGRDATGFWNPATESLQLIGTVAARPATGTEGQSYYATDTDTVYWWSGTAWITGVHMGQWGTWTPAVGNITVGNGTWDCRYFRMGWQIEFWMKFTFGSTSAFTGGILMSLPALPNSWFTVNTPMGEAWGLDQGVSVYAGRAIATTNSAVNGKIHVTNQASPVAGYNATVPFTWANTDQLFIHGSYFTASQT